MSVLFRVSELDFCRLINVDSIPKTSSRISKEESNSTSFEVFDDLPLLGYDLASSKYKKENKWESLFHDKFYLRMEKL